MDKKRFIIIGLMLLCIICIFFWRVIFLGETTVAADILQQWYPWKSCISDASPPHNNSFFDNIIFHYPTRLYGSEMIKKGQVPLWDPYIFCGIPFLANIESAVFSPLSLIFYLFPTKKAFGYSNIVQLFLAGLFMSLFMNTIKVSFFGSFIASLVFMFNGFFMLFLGDPNFVATGLWFPLIFLFLEKMICGSQTYFFAVITGVILAFMFLSGHIQLSLYIAAAVVIYTFLRISEIFFYKKKIKDILRYFLLLGISFAIGFGLAAIQIIPFFELVPLSQRVGDLYKYKFQLIDLSRIFYLITFIIPDIYGNPVDNNYWGLGGDYFYRELYGYMGILPLILAIFAIYRWKHKKNRVVISFLLIAAFSLLVYLKTPLLALFYLIPGYNKTLVDSRVIFLYASCISILAGFGADYLEKREDLKSKIKALNKSIIICLFIGTFLFLFGNLALQMSRDYILSHTRSNIDIYFSGELNFGIMVQNFFRNFSTFYSRYLKYYYLLSPVIYIPFLLIIASIMIFSLYLKKGASVFLKIILSVIVTVDLFYFGIRQLTTAKPQMIYPEVEAIKFLKKDPTLWRAVSSMDSFPPNSMVPYEIQSINGHIALFPKRYVEVMHLIDKDITMYPYPFWIYLSKYNSTLIDILNVKYILTKKEINENKFRLIYNKDILIYKNTKVFPRAFVVPEAIVIKEKKEILQHLSRDDFEPHKYIILEEEPKVNYTHSLSSSGPLEVNITRYSPHLVSIDTNLSNPGFLVLSDSYYPGWKVYIDGRQEKILCANYIMRAVYLNKGSHKVDFIYDPISFKIGRYISILSLALVMLFLAIHWVMRLRKR